jgi:hypothetical protein
MPGEIGLSRHHGCHQTGEFAPILARCRLLGTSDNSVRLVVTFERTFVRDPANCSAAFPADNNFATKPPLFD